MACSQSEHEERDPSLRVMTAEEVLHFNQESLALLQEREESLNLHEAAVNEMMTNMDRVFVLPPRSIYGDIQPGKEEEILPSQVTLLRLRRKRQDAAVERYRFHKAVTKYIIQWRARMLRKFQSQHLKKVAFKLYTRKSFMQWCNGLKCYTMRKKQCERAAAIAVATRILVMFSQWKKREIVNRRARQISRLFSNNCSAWKRWQQCLRRSVSSSFVKMKADFTAYEHLLRKHGRLVLNALYVRKPLVSVRIVMKFARHQALKRGFCSIERVYWMSSESKRKYALLCKKKKHAFFSFWQRFLLLRRKINELEATEKCERTRRRKLHRVRIGMEKYFDLWKATAHSSSLIRHKYSKSKVHHRKNMMRRAISAWSTGMRFGSKAQMRAVTKAMNTKRSASILSCLSQWRRHVGCLSDNNIQLHHNRAKLFMDYKKRYTRQCLINNATPKIKIAVSFRKLGVENAIQLHKQLFWIRFRNALDNSQEFRTWNSTGNSCGYQFYAHRCQLSAMNAFLRNYEQSKDQKDNIILSSNWYSSSKKRSSFSQWQYFNQVTKNIVKPSMIAGMNSYFQRMGNLFIHGLVQKCEMSEMDRKSRIHRNQVQLSKVLATLARNVNKRRAVASKIVNNNSDTLQSCDVSRQGKVKQLYLDVTSQSRIKYTWKYPRESYFPLNSLLFCVSAHDSRRKKGVSMKTWITYVVRVREELQYQKQVGDERYYQHLQMSGMASLKSYRIKSQKLKLLFEEMMSFHIFMLTKRYLRQWNEHKAKRNYLFLNWQRGIGKRNYLSCKNCLSQWQKFAVAQKLDRKEISLATAASKKSSCVRFMRLVVSIRKQTNMIKSSEISYRKRLVACTFKRYSLKAKHMKYNRSQFELGKKQKIAWTWYLMINRMEENKRNKKFFATALSTAIRHRSSFKTARAVVKWRMWTKMTKLLKNCFTNLTYLRRHKMMMNLFDRMASAKAKTDAQVLRGEMHKRIGMLEGGLHMFRRYFEQQKGEFLSATIGHQFYIRQLLKKFFIAHDMNIKAPKRCEAVRMKHGELKYYLWCKRRYLLKWCTTYRAKNVKNSLMSQLVWRFLQSQGWRLFRARTKVLLKGKKHLNSVTTWHNLKRKRTVVIWLKKLLHFRRATIVIRKSKYKWHFYKFRRCCAALLLGRKVEVCTRRVVKKIVRHELRESLRRWVEFCRLENIAIKLLSNRINNLYLNSISNWSKRMKICKKFKFSCPQASETGQSPWKYAALRNAVHQICAQTRNQMLQKDLLETSRRYIFSTYLDRFVDRRIVAEQLKENLQRAHNHYEATLLQNQLRLWISHLESRCHQKYTEYTEENKYFKRKLHDGLRKLHSFANACRKRRRLDARLKDYCAVQRKRRVFHVLDCSATRRWGQKVESSMFDNDTATRKLYCGFHRLLQNKRMNKHVVKCN